MNLRILPDFRLLILTNRYAQILQGTHVIHSVGQQQVGTSFPHTPKETLHDPNPREFPRGITDSFFMLSFK